MLIPFPVSSLSTQLCGDWGRRVLFLFAKQSRPTCAAQKWSYNLPLEQGQLTRDSILREKKISPLPAANNCRQLQDYGCDFCD